MLAKVDLVVVVVAAQVAMVANPLPVSMVTYQYHISSGTNHIAID